MEKKRILLIDCGLESLGDGIIEAVTQTSSTNNHVVVKYLNSNDHSNLDLIQLGVNSSTGLAYIGHDLQTATLVGNYNTCSCVIDTSTAHLIAENIQENQRAKSQFLSLVKFLEFRRFGDEVSLSATNNLLNAFREYFKS